MGQFEKWHPDKFKEIGSFNFNCKKRWCLLKYVPRTTVGNISESYIIKVGETPSVGETRNNNKKKNKR